MDANQRDEFKRRAAARRGRNEKRLNAKTPRTQRSQRGRAATKGIGMGCETGFCDCTKNLRENVRFGRIALQRTARSIANRRDAMKCRRRGKMMLWQNHLKKAAQKNFGDNARFCEIVLQRGK